MQYTIYVNPTNKCNLNCDHCYHSIVNPNDSMTNDDLDKVVAYVTNFADLHKQDTINVHLHGGEVMMYNDLDALYDFIRKVKATGNVVVNITTNLVYTITKQHIRIFNEIADKTIQTSWDYGNIRFKNKRQASLWFDNVKLLTALGFTVQPTVCVTKQLVENTKPFYLFAMFETLGLNSCNFERITRTGRAADNDVIPTNKQIQKWLLEAYKLYEKRLDPSFVSRVSGAIKSIPLFDGIRDSFTGNLTGCRARKCTHTVQTINPNLTIATCPNTCDYPVQMITGTINPKRIVEIQSQEDHRDNRCYQCQYFQYCNGDCFQLQYCNRNDDDYCYGLKSIYEYITNKPSHTTHT